MKIKLKSKLSFLIIIFNIIFLIYVYVKLPIKVVKIVKLKVIKNLNQNQIPSKNTHPKIFCIILTSKANLDLKAKVIYDTWATKCDNFKFVTLIPEHLQKRLKEYDPNTINFKVKNDRISFSDDNYEPFYQSLVQPPGLVEDIYTKLTDKVYLTFKHFVKKYDNYDWYLKADDDSFVFVDNLRKFLSDKNSTEPVTYGYDIKRYVPMGYHSGGGGYVLSNEAFKRIGNKLNEDYKFCPNSGFEDRDVGKCLRLLDVFPKKSIDSLGRERFHPMHLSNYFYGEFTGWWLKYSANPVRKVNSL